MADLIRDPDMDRLVADLNRDTNESSATTTPGPDIAEPVPLAPLRRVQVDDDEPLAKLLAQAVQLAASDLHLLTGSPPVVRVNGDLRVLEAPPVDGDELALWLRPHLDGRARERLATDGATDFSLRLGGAEDGSGAYRFRVNLHRTQGRMAAAIRALPRGIPTLAQLGLPSTLARLVAHHRGLLLVTGPSGSGKTTTLAALIDEINRNRAAHILTIEDPVEYQHRNQRSFIQQLEVGQDTSSFAHALRAALRQDPDVILVGEMRDLETTATALTAAETGHLVLATVHTNDVAQTVHRLVDVFHSERQSQIRQQLAMALTAIVSQQLVPRLDGRGRVPAVEVLRATYPVRHHIRRNQLQKLYDEIRRGRNEGMVSMEESLTRLVAEGVIGQEEARVRAGHPDELDSLLRG